MKKTRNPLPYRREMEWPDGAKRTTAYLYPANWERLHEYCEASGHTKTFVFNCLISGLPEIMGKRSKDRKISAACIK